MYLAVLAIVILLQSPTGKPYMNSTETSHPSSFDSFVCPPTCTARNFQLRKIYEALTNRVNPVISSEGSFFKNNIIHPQLCRVASLGISILCLSSQSVHTKAPNSSEDVHQFCQAQQLRWLLSVNLVSSKVTDMLEGCCKLQRGRTEHPNEGCLVLEVSRTESLRRR